MIQHRKRAMILSLLGMGLGQLYNRQFVKGVLLFLLHIAGIGLAFSLPRAVWGLTTLGEKSDHLEKVGKVYVNVRGDHSIFLLIEGMIVILAMAIVASIYIANVRDAYLIGKRRDQGEQAPHFVETLQYLKGAKFPQMVIFIPVLLVVFFTLMPILFMILLAFTNYSAPNFLPPAKLVSWIGLEGFKNIFTIKAWNQTFFGVALWTLIWTVCATLTTFTGGFVVALMVQKKGIRFKGFWRTLFIIPYAIPQFISLLIMRNMFNGEFGPINQYLGYFGLGGLPWLTDPFWAKFTVIVVNIWIGFPITMLMVIGILSTISRDLYEAAQIDGASPFQQFNAITLPTVLFSFGPLLVMSFAGNINNFNLIYLLTNGNPANPAYQSAGSTDILITWLYKLTMDSGKYNFASIIGIFIFIIVSSFAIANIRRTKAFKEEDLHR
ncbi:carbohydrate ABC transporter permease [Paenibacillus tianjinensis]|uniref:Maltose/maltodextrin transport system permease protein n=1 Tax=Paenibacillus tianjinensis TaxID=2810347 RepID=A0ABX7LGW2_9BACL|nr:sugar ABC transporter permease [Paenibacillus tianjinensis]QSF46219.1 sugar ABC transporter permease [Paenibacillus tianjinensis]